MNNAADVFWGEIAPCAHIVQLYENLDVLMDSLEGFIGGGLESGGAAVVIATPIHLMLLDQRLEARGIDVGGLTATDQYIRLEAEETLQTFMVNGWPDADLFSRSIRGILARARGKGRKVRAFGEMVALLWAGGQRDAVVRLEQLWHSLCQSSKDMSLLCSYPQADITADGASAIAEVFRAHTAVLGAAPAPVH